METKAGLLCKLAVRQPGALSFYPEKIPNRFYFEWERLGAIENASFFEIFYM